MTGLGSLLLRRTPTGMLLGVGAAIVTGRVLRWLWLHPWWLFALSSLLLLVSAFLRDAATAATTLVVAGLVVGFAVAGCAWLAPSSFERRLAGPLRSWRRRRYYERRWSPMVEGCGLIRADTEPVLMGVRSSGGIDRLEVHMAPGQLVSDWRDAAPRVAGALEVRSVRPRSVRGQPRDVLLLVRQWVRAIDPGGDAVWVAGPEPDEAEVAEVAEIEADAAGDTGVPIPPPVRPRGAFPRRPR